MCQIDVTCNTWSGCATVTCNLCCPKSIGWQKVTHALSFESACVGAFPRQLFMNTIICFCSCWNDGSHCVTTLSVLPKNLAARICGVTEPKKTGCVSCASKKRNKCWSFPYRWLISRYSHTQRAVLQKQPHFLPLSHEAGQKERDILWLWLMACRWSGKDRGAQPPGARLSVC